MAENELDAFLKGPEPAQPEPSAAVPEPGPSVAEDNPGKGTPEAQPAVQAKAEPEADDDAEPPEPQAGERAVPLRVLEDERHRRQDWKAKAIEAETRREELQRQLEEAKRAVAAPQPQPQPQPQYRPPQEEIPNPAIDPAGWMAYHERQLAHREMMQRANFSEMMLRKEIGSEKVDALLVEWQQAVARDRTLVQRAAQENDPYGWAHKQLERLRAQAEIGDDPAAWREAERERLRAEIGAAAPNGGAPRVSPAAGMQPSLAGARSVAPRSAPAFTGPLSLDDILAPVNGAGRQARH